MEWIISIIIAIIISPVLTFLGLWIATYPDRRKIDSTHDELFSDDEFNPLEYIKNELSNSKYEDVAFLDLNANQEWIKQLNIGLEYSIDRDCIKMTCHSFILIIDIRLYRYEFGLEKLKVEISITRHALIAATLRERKHERKCKEAERIKRKKHEKYWENLYQEIKKQLGPPPPSLKELSNNINLSENCISIDTNQMTRNVILTKKEKELEINNLRDRLYKIKGIG